MDSYETYSPMANKLLNPDGSVATFGGEAVSGPDASRAAQYETMMPRANKFLNPDGSISTLDEITGGGGGVIPVEGVSIAVGTVTTGEPGTNADITNSGTPTAAVFDFTIPRGDTGLQGIQGQKGEQGIQGLPGEAAVANIAYKGPWVPGTYVKNDCVIAPADGHSYVCVAETTAQEPGVPDNDDWHLWVQKGPPGPQGVQGIQGDQGLQGQQGVQGIQGPQGLPGEAGQDGAQGPKGDPGSQGLTGAPGQDGAQGPKGDPGPQGLPGEAGQDGAQGPKGDPGQDFDPADVERITALEETVGGLNEKLAAVLDGDGGETPVSPIAPTALQTNIYEFRQTAAAYIWSITHNLDFKYVSVLVVDSSDNTIRPDVRYINSDTVKLVFENAVRGTAIIRR